MNDAARERKDYWLCVGNGGVTMMGLAFFAHDTVMAGLTYQLTGSPVLVGLYAAVAVIGWQWPQLFVGRYIESLPLKMPVYRSMAGIRLVSIAAMAGSVILFSDRPYLLYWLLLLFMFLLSSAGGISLIPFFEILARAVPYERRNMLFAWRRLTGGLLGFVAGLIVLWVLSDRFPVAYPYDYAFLFGISLVINAVGYGCFCWVSEHPEHVDKESVTFTQFLRRGPKLFRDDRDFRLFYLYRVCLSAGSMSQALFVPFFIARFNAPLERTGLFSAVVALVGGLSGVVWGRLAVRMGEVRMMQFANMTLAAAPAMALLLDWSLDGAMLQRLGDYYLPLALFMFGSHTAALSGVDIGGTVYLLALPPARQRATYMAFYHTLIAPLTALPILAGWLAAEVSYGLAFALSTFFAILGTLIAAKLRQRHA